MPAILKTASRVPGGMPLFIPVRIQIVSPGAGDIDNNEDVDLADAVIGLQILSGIDIAGNPDADVDGDNRIGFWEVPYIL